MRKNTCHKQSQTHVEKLGCSRKETESQVKLQTKNAVSDWTSLDWHFLIWAKYKELLIQDENAKAVRPRFDL